MEEALNAYNITLLLHWAKRGKNIFEFTSMEGAAAKSSRRVVLDGIIQSNSNHLSGQVKFLDTVPKTNIAVEKPVETAF